MREERGKGRRAGREVRSYEGNSVVYVDEVKRAELLFPLDGNVVFAANASTPCTLVKEGRFVGEGACGGWA